MVYRGKPSAGCEQCRKSKKSCTLERPGCTRCVKLKKVCGGYRDLDTLQIQDESQAVIRKAQRAAQAYEERQRGLVWPETGLSAALQHFNPSDTDNGLSSEPLSAGDLNVATVFPALEGDETRQINTLPSDALSFGYVLPLGILPRANDVATGYFFKQFTSNRHWNFLGGVTELKMDPCLDFAIRACGMAALDNVRPITRGRVWSRQFYAEALSMLNAALQDPVAVKRDQSLIAVAMLSYYENLTCDSRQSIESWKAHIRGATQMLRLRGRSQLDTEVGRALFREFRSQILTHCIWDDTQVPAFLWDWNEELASKTHYQSYVEPGDELTKHCMEFADLRSEMRLKTISTTAAISKAADIERHMISWGLATPSVGRMWAYHESYVPDSPHIWNGLVHTFENQNAPTPGAWNFWRSMRILLSRTQEELAAKIQLSDADRQKQKSYLLTVRRQMTDGICATIPVALGHANSAEARCVLITAYGSIWPLFFAATCALERVGKRWWDLEASLVTKDPESAGSAAAAQARWVIGRMEYISREVGLRWAEGVASTLKGDFSIHWDLLPEEERRGEMQGTVHTW